MRHIYKTKTHRLRKQIYGYQRRKRRGEINWEFGTDVYTVLYLK